MRFFTRYFAVVAVLLLGFGYGAQAAADGEWSGFVSGEAWYFSNTPPSQPDLYQTDLSVGVQPEYFREWDEGRQLFKFTGFARIDERDSERTHADIRELTWVKAAEDHEWRLGVRKVFWGVTEFVHLVDIINQTDFVENPNSEEKLGQPMLNYALIKNWGTLDFFALVGFRERTFPCLDCRFQTDPPIDPDQSIIEDENRIDWTVRYSQVFGDWDVGLYYFNGIARDPRFVVGRSNTLPVLVPVYEKIEQVAFDVQSTKGNWLWKLEGFWRSGQGPTFSSATGGFEYTFVGAFKTPMDVGVVGEYIWDERGDDALTPFEDDVALGVRLTFNDAQSTDLLFGVIADVDKSSRVYQLEGSRRLGERWKISIEGRLFADIDPTDFFLFGVRDDDFIRVELARFF
ncbi:MAG: hypothetical protein ACE5K1_10605 [Acidiferrobacterales bacterium]